MVFQKENEKMQFFLKKPVSPYRVILVKVNAQAKKKRCAFSLTKAWCAFSLTKKRRVFIHLDVTAVR